VIATYPPCDGGQDESGPERVYELALTERTLVPAGVVRIVVDSFVAGGQPRSGRYLLIVVRA
jgi:hypothetical protein